MTKVIRLINKTKQEKINQDKKSPNDRSRMTVRNYKKFNLAFLSLSLIPVLILGLVNSLVDPYHVIKSPVIPRFNESKPEMFSHVRLYKAFEVVQFKPEVILLGNSRTEWGLNPQHPILNKYRTYNLGFSGANMQEVLQYFNHAISNQKDLKIAVIGLDFIMFDEEFYVPDYSAQNILEKKRINYQEFIKVIFSLDALKSSYKTIKQNIYLNYPDHRVFRGMAKIDLRRPTPGSYDNFTQWIRAGIKLYPNFKLSSDKLADFRRLVEICRQNGIELKIFISPIHATQIEAIRVSGKWSIFEQWKRNLVNIAPVWDFSGYNSVTTEAVSTKMKNYIDSSHYREEIGNLILARLFADTNKNYPQDFGSLVTPENIESHLNDIRNAQQIWIEKHPEEVNLVQDVKKNPYKKLKSEGRIF